jgi:hypothetical protein
MKKPFVITGLAVSALVLLLVGFDLVGTIIWEGSAPLQLQLKSQSGRKLEKLSVDSLRSWQWADAFRNDPNNLDISLKPVEDFDGARGTADVRSSGASSGLGRELSYVRDPVLVLEVVYADGEKRLELAEVPERGQPQVIEVTVP